MPAVILGWPTLSQLRNADYSYFEQLAGYLDHISPEAEDALEALAEDVERPGGIEWEGEAADAAIAQAGADLVMARPVMWSWDDVAVSTRRWQGQLEAGTRTALDAVDDAERDGFEVNENYSVRDTREAKTQAQYNERLAEAQAHSNFIRHHVGTLVSNESRINGELKAMTAEWGTLTFPESGGAGNVQAVGHGFQTGPMLPRDHGNDRPWEYNIDLKSGLLLAGPGHPNAGTVAGIDDVWNELHRCFSCNFPIGGAPHAFPKAGDHIPLSVGMGSNGPNMPFPVEVTQISRTANAINIEFKTLPGHVDGEGPRSTSDSTRKAECFTSASRV
jgi:hypothetical protein